MTSSKLWRPHDLKQKVISWKFISPTANGCPVNSYTEIFFVSVFYEKMRYGSKRTFQQQHLPLVNFLNWMLVVLSKPNLYLSCLSFKVNGFRSYVDLYVKDKLDETGVALKVVNETVNDRWEVCLTMSEKGFQQISFVNSIATTKVSKCQLSKK